MTDRTQRRSTLRLAAFALLAMLPAPAGLANGPTAAFAQGGAAATERASAAGRRVNELAARDVEAARALAWETSRRFGAEGEGGFSARFAMQAARLDASLGRWSRLGAEIGSRLETFLADLEPEDGADLIGLALDAAGHVGDRPAQEALASRLTQYVRNGAGEGSEADLAARIKVAYSFLETGDIEGGSQRLRTALRASALTTNDALTVRGYTDAALSFAAAGRVDEAERFFAEGLKSRAATTTTPELGVLWFERSRLLGQAGRIDEAIRAAEEAKPRLEGAYGPDSAESIAAGDNLSSLLVNHGAVASGLNMAEETYERALRGLGDAEPLTWRTANDYAEALRMVGFPDYAGPIDEELLRRRLDHYGRASIQALVSASNLALDRLALGDERGALEGFALQRDLSAELADPASEHVAQSEAWIRYTKAFFHPDVPMDEAALEAMAAIKDWNGAPDILRIRSAQLAADRFEARDQSDRSLALRIDAYERAAKAFSPAHPVTFEARLAVAKARVRRGDADALANFEDLERQLFDWMLREVGTAGNRFVAEVTRRLADGILFDFAQYALTEPGAAPAYAQAMARWKTMEDGQRTRLRLAADGLANGASRTLAETVVRLSGQQQELLSSGRIDEAARRVLGRLASARRDLAGHPDVSEALAGETPPIAARIDAALTPKDALVDFVRSARNSGAGADARARDDDDTRLLAIVWRKGEPPTLSDLGSMADIQALGAAPAEEGEDARFRNLHAALFGKIEPRLAGVERLFIVPDGELYSLPFSRLETEDGRAMDEVYELRLLTRTDALLFADRRQRPEPGERVVLAGGLNFASGDNSGAPALAFSGQEVERIGAIAGRLGWRTELLTGTAGTETAIHRTAEGAGLVHLATHGFFDPAQDMADALWRSGLVLARSGAEGPPHADASDGFLYAHEMMDWDLSRADLVVLSACETALGDPSRISSLRGLPTGLAIAGARRSLLALWTVDDEGTANFMTRFYEHLAENGATYPQALRRTRLEAMRGEIARAGDPTLWAAFVLFEN